ncbi:hypothetical protein HK096_001910, partial [Nowakowskiella sp. JEL0078]
ERIKDKKKNVLASIDADNLILVRVFETGKTSGIPTSAGNTIAALVNDVRNAGLVEDTAYDGELPGFKWLDASGKVSAKVMNPSYDLGDYGLTQNSVKGTIDIVVMVPLLGNLQFLL